MNQLSKQIRRKKYYVFFETPDVWETVATSPVMTISKLTQIWYWLSGLRFNVCQVVLTSASCIPASVLLWWSRLPQTRRCLIRVLSVMLNGSDQTSFWSTCLLDMSYIVPALVIFHSRNYDDCIDKYEEICFNTVLYFQKRFYMMFIAIFISHVGFIRNWTRSVF